MAKKQKRKGLTKQVEENLTDKLKIGFSKYEDKKLGITQNHIYSWSTFRTYLKHGCYFVKWCKQNFDCRNLEDCRNYVDDYLKMRINNNISPYTQKLESSAIAKIYNCSTTDFIKTETRHRKNITRSRGSKKRDKYFSEENNKSFIEFCKSTGLRRSELENLKKEDLFKQEDSYYLTVKGKGGRIRSVPIISESSVNLILNSDNINEYVFDKIPNGADIHSYRADYCTSIYLKFARNIKNIPRDEIYYCRGDLKGVKYDKKAMLIASNVLGHNRISVIAGHYLKS